MRISQKWMTADTEKATKSEKYRDKDDNRCKNTAKFENIPKTDDSRYEKGLLLLEKPAIRRVFLHFCVSTIRIFFASGSCQLTR